MNNCKILGALAAALLIAAMSSVAVGQDKATPQEVVAQLMEAASTLSKTGDLTQSNQEPSLRVWKDTYIFALDCDTMTNAAHPLRPDIRDSEMSSIKDPKGIASSRTRRVFAKQQGNLPGPGRSTGGRSPVRNKAPAKSIICWVPKEPRTRLGADHVKYATPRSPSGFKLHRICTIFERDCTLLAAAEPPD